MHTSSWHSSGQPPGPGFPGGIFESWGLIVGGLATQSIDISLLSATFFCTYFDPHRQRTPYLPVLQFLPWILQVVHRG